MRPLRFGTMGALVAVLVVASTLALPATGASPAPTVRTHRSHRVPGPALSVTSRQLDRALACSGPLRGAQHDPVLLTPAFSTGEQSYGAGYARQLPTLGIPTCTLSLPDDGFRDLQHDAEYDVRAIRLMSQVSGRQVIVLGHQHGGLDALWALTYWPDLAPKVSDFISLATPYQGTSGARALCARGLRLCPPAFWQISTGSRFLAALASRPLPAGPSYTSIATAYDELITPQPKASTLRGATNIQLQTICPGHLVEHFTILFDNLTYRIVMDAIDHPGPAVAARIPRSVCSGSPVMPGVTKAGVAEVVKDAVGFGASFAIGIPTQAVRAEPPLRGYARDVPGRGPGG